MMQRKAPVTGSTAPSSGNGGESRRRGPIAFPKFMGSTARNLCVLLLAGGLGMIFMETIAIISPMQGSTDIKPFVDAREAGTSLVECTVTTQAASIPPSKINPKGAPANGVMHITVRHDLSPLASEVFIHLVKDRHFDGVFLFRVLPNFVAQFGFRHEGLEDIEVGNLSKTPKMDAVHAKTLKNFRGTLSFAGGNPVTKQVFVNLGYRASLDKESRPFAIVDAYAMATVLDKLYTGYKDGSGQIKAMKKGEQAMRQTFPYMSQIEKCEVVREFSEGKSR